jgi:hypothetical protein
VGLYSYTSFAGSFGLPVEDRRTGEVMMLTAAHVIGGLFPIPTTMTGVVGYGDLAEEDPHETQTAPVPAISAAIGRLERSIPPSREQRCTVDAALARVSNDRELRNQIDGQTVAGVRDIRGVHDTDIPVTMFGARSNRREGILNTAPVAERLRLGSTEHLIFYERACQVRSLDGEPFAVRGDSGSILIDEECRAVAMVVGMLMEDGKESDCALATPLVPVLDGLEVDLYDGKQSITTGRLPRGWTES